MKPNITMGTLGTGRRKTSVCRVHLVPGNGQIKINQKPHSDYLQQNPFLTSVVEEPLTFLQLKDDFDLFIHVYGGGLIGQTEAMRLGIARALCNMESDYRIVLKRKGYLKQDSRNKERKKYGLKKARKAPQFSKR